MAITLDEQIALMKNEIGARKRLLMAWGKEYDKDLETCQAILQSLESLKPTVRGEVFEDE